jgi:hypothetical protein
MVTYALLSATGQPLAHNLSIPTAAHRLHIRNGHDYSILPRQNAPGYTLWTMVPGADAIATAIVSADEDTARSEIYAALIEVNRKEHGMTVVDDAVYELWLSGFGEE